MSPILVEASAPILAFGGKMVSFLRHLPMDKARFALALLSLYPLSFLYRVIPQSRVVTKHVYGTSLGLALCYLLYGQKVLVHVISTAVVWLMVRLLPVSVSPLAVSASSLLFLNLCHLYRAYSSYLNWRIDFTVSQMLITMKFFHYAFDTAVYRRKRSRVRNPKLGPSHRPSPQLDKYINAVALDHDPTLLEYLSYTFWYSTVLVGPVVPLKSHLDFVHLRFAESGRIPRGGIRQGLKIGLYSLFMLPGVFAQTLFAIENMFQPWYHELPFWQRGLYAWLAISLCRFPYYFAWILSEGASIISGLGWSADGRWQGASNVRPLRIETSTSPREIIQHWNIRANHWLKYYVYLRLEAPFNRFAMPITFLISAVWHGIYPGYYLSFGMVSLVTSVYRQFYKALPQPFIKSNPLIKLGMGAFNNYVMGYCLLSFVLLDLRRSAIIYASLKWHVHFIMAGLYIVTCFMSSCRSRVKQT